MDQKIIRDIRLLKLYAGILTAAVILLTFYIFTERKDHLRVTELDVERINIIEEDETLKMVISNRHRQHPGLSNFKNLPVRDREAGIIFFNSAGDECGGLVYDGTEKEAGMVFSVDQFRNDQLMQLQYAQTGTGDSMKRHYGLQIWDRSDQFTLAQQIALVDSMQRDKLEAALENKFKELRERGLLGVQRMFAGKTDAGEVGLFIRDDKGRIRIKIFCDNQNNPQVIILDENGAVKG